MRASPATARTCLPPTSPPISRSPLRCSPRPSGAPRSSPRPWAAQSSPPPTGRRWRRWWIRARPAGWSRPAIPPPGPTPSATAISLGPEGPRGHGLRPTGVKRARTPLFGATRMRRRHPGGLPRCAGRAVLSRALADYSRILVIKLGALGDVVQAVRRLWPADPPRPSERQDHPFLDHAASHGPLAAASGLCGPTVETDGRPERMARDPGPGQQRLRRARYDRVYDLQTSSRSRSLFLCLPAQSPPEWSGISPGRPASAPHKSPARPAAHPRPAGRPASRRWALAPMRSAEPGTAPGTGPVVGARRAGRRAARRPGPFRPKPRPACCAGPERLARPGLAKRWLAIDTVRRVGAASWRQPGLPRRQGW